MKKGDQRMTMKPNRQSALCNVVGISQVFKTGNCVTTLFPANRPAITGPIKKTKSFQMGSLNGIIVTKNSNYASVEFYVSSSRITLSSFSLARQFYDQYFFVKLKPSKSVIITNVKFLSKFQFESLDFFVTVNFEFEGL